MGKRIHIPKRTLERLYYDEGLTQEEIAERCGCSMTTIRQRMRGYGLAIRTAGVYTQIEIPCETLRQLYVEQGLTTYEIANRWSCSESTVCRRLRDCGIAARTRNDYYRIEISRQELQALYDEGLTQEKIADRLGCSESTVHQRMLEYGLETRTPSDYCRIEISYETLQTLYVERELTSCEIADILDCSPNTVLRRLREYGIPLRPGGIPDKERVPTEVLANWTPELAYAVGLLAADGNLVKREHAVSLASTDRELIETFRACLQLDPALHTHERQRSDRKSVYTIKFTDRAFRAFLEGLGLTPAKSKTLGPLVVPRVVFRDFARGCWDGDGCWHIDQGGYLIAILSSVSLTFLEWMRESIERQTGIQGGISGINLYYCGSKAVTLGHWMYYAPDVPALSRKREIWERFGSEGA